MATKIVCGTKEYFPRIGKISYEGPKSKNPLAFKYYDEDKVIAGKKMKDHFRFAVAYWHTFCGTGADPFGPGTKAFPWLKKTDPMQLAFDKLDAAFEFISKLGVPFYCFHDRDMAPEGNSIAGSEKNLMELVKAAKAKQKASGVKLLWGTSNLFSHPRYMNGAATNPDFCCAYPCRCSGQSDSGSNSRTWWFKLCFLGGSGWLFFPAQYRYEERN